MPSGQAERSSLSQTEIAEAIRGLPDAGWYKLRKIARAYANISPLEADDLLQEALSRAIAGTRQCPTQVDVIRFLAGVMRSIASDSVKGVQRQQETQEGQPALHTMLPIGGDDADSIADCSPTPEESLAAEQVAARIKDVVLRLFDDDLIAQTIIDGDMEDMEAEEIRALTGLDKVAFASKRRFIRRRIERALPKGWKP